MTADEIVKILEACAKTGVNKFMYDGINIEMGSVADKVCLPEVQIHDKPEDLQKFEEEIRIKEKKRLTEEALAELNLLDPVSYDKYLQNGGLEVS